MAKTKYLYWYTFKFDWKNDQGSKRTGITAAILGRTQAGAKKAVRVSDAHSFRRGEIPFRRYNYRLHKRELSGYAKK